MRYLRSNFSLRGSEHPRNAAQYQPRYEMQGLAINGPNRATTHLKDLGTSAVTPSVWLPSRCLVLC